MAQDDQNMSTNLTHLSEYLVPAAWLSMFTAGQYPLKQVADHSTQRNPL